MREREIFRCPHLHEARGRALELACLVAFGSLVKGGWFCCRGSKQLHACLVQCVDQRDETLGFIAVSVGHDRHTIDHDRVELMRDTQVVNGTERLLAKVMKTETRRPHGS